MRYVLVLLALGGCGNTLPTPPDLSTSQDMTKEGRGDLSTPPDLALPKCLLPVPGIYNEQTYFGYRTTLGGSDAFTGSGITVVVQPDGTVLRQSTPITGVTLWRCDSPMMQNPVDCQAACCNGDPSTVPMVYFSRNGWALFRPGQCQWKDQNLVNYFIDVTNVSGRAN